jgi:uncharacterized membrane protein YdbT with pleckstrin-like domain
VADTVIRPSLKFIRLGYVLVGILLIGTLYLWRGGYLGEQGYLAPIAAAALLIWPAQKHLKRQLTKVTVSGDKLRYESGMASKVTRTIQLPKVQDVTVMQSIGQRIWGVGDLSIETAGETSRLTILNIDGPQAVADGIIDASHKSASAERGLGV